ncbi:MAG: RnfABCDGE type electron transport complex subunit B [Nitrospirae bacterium]|nr:RnfABCDGE type electron transport complex subunit B [Nitrospirota bacterium]
MLTEAIISLGTIGFALGAGLSLAAKKLAVEIDLKEAAAQAVLPGANCGACGYPGCSGFAAAVARGEAPVNACVVGGEAVVKQLAAIMGVEASANEKKVAVIFCAGGNTEAKKKFEYYGAQDCRAAILVAGGNKTCSNSCLGLASCVKVCPFDAMEMNENGLPVVFEDKCTGCGKCVEECPKQIISLIPISKKVHIRFS